MPKRPKKPIRVFVLVAAVACLGLTMCMFSKKPDPAPATTAVPAEPAATAASGSSEPAAQPQQPQTPPAEQTKKPKPKQPYFPATKSAGPLR